MSFALPGDLQEMIAAHLATGNYSTEEDVLREALRALSEAEEDNAAIKAALDDLRAGDEGEPLEVAFDSIRASLRDRTTK